MADRRPRFEAEPEPDLSTLWILPFGNLMTLLMIFFLALFGFTYASGVVKFEAGVFEGLKKVEAMSQEEMQRLAKQAEAAANPAAAEAAEAEQGLESQVKAMFEEKAVSQVADLKVEGERFRILLPSPVLFKPGSADLGHGARKVLHRVAEILRPIRNDIVVEGHTDASPVRGRRFKSNWELSLARSLAVIRYLAHAEGIDFRRFGAAGYGEYQPVAANDTEADRTKNRRIEINIVRRTA